MIHVQSQQAAVDLMTHFAERTGLASSRPPRRYLWTDAFAVCNFIGLSRITGESRFMELARHLIDQVHHVLGRHRPDDPRAGWISGLEEDEGEAHPTLGGLRIGKELPEREPGEAVDDRLEWDRDGQYFHYLTKWMHALDVFARETGDTVPRRWARELAQAAFRAFAYRHFPGGPVRLFWKMSIDLARPLVDSMGHHDPLDGLITFRQLDLNDEAEVMALACKGQDWETDDPLGLGGLMSDAFRLDQLHHEAGLKGRVLDEAASGLDCYLRQRPFDRSIGPRLPFRELGLCIGLRAVDLMRQGSPDPVLERIHGHASATPCIQNWWRDRRTSESWLAHEDINDVMLATSLAPEGFLELR